MFYFQRELVQPRAAVLIYILLVFFLFYLPDRRILDLYLAIIALVQYMIYVCKNNNCYLKHQDNVMIYYI